MGIEILLDREDGSEEFWARVKVEGSGTSFSGETLQEISDLFAHWAGIRNGVVRDVGDFRAWIESVDNDGKVYVSW